MVARGCGYLLSPVGLISDLEVEMGLVGRDGFVGYECCCLLRWSPWGDVVVVPQHCQVTWQSGTCARRWLLLMERDIEGGGDRILLMDMVVEGGGERIASMEMGVEGGRDRRQATHGRGLQWIWALKVLEIGYT